MSSEERQLLGAEGVCASTVWRAGTLFFCFLPTVLCLLLSTVSPAVADSKGFSGGGDGSSWDDGANWFPLGEPGQSDEVSIDQESASVTVSDDFLARSVTVGGAETSAWTVNSFVYGTVVPASTSDPAVYIRKDGTATLKGSGTITMKGSFKNSEVGLADQPSIMILLE